jgi:Mg-chelatase subunit ChlD
MSAATFLVRSAVAVFALLIAGTVNVRAETNMMFILDASNSMWGQIDGVSKIETARSVLSGLLADIGADTKVGLMAYGHRNKTSCDDIQVIAPVGADTPKQLIAALNKIQPTGMTPIAGALKAAGRTFANKSDNNNVVLISDGIETCNGDPCAVAGALSSAGIKTRVHVIGFDVDEAARKQLKCIADAGHGTYLNAKNAGELKVAVAEVKKVAQAAPEPKEPPKPAVNAVFKDEFDGKNLKPVWKVTNPDPDAYLVEKGHLLMIAHPNAGFNHPKAPNLLQLSQEMPDGDWEMKTTVQVDYQTNVEQVWLGLYGDEKNYIAALLQANPIFTGMGSFRGVELHLKILKAIKGKQTKFDKLVRAIGCDPDVCKKVFPGLVKKWNVPMTLSLVRKGRKFFARAVVQGDVDKDGHQIVHETDVVSSLRAPGGPALAVGQSSQTDGETLFYFDRFEIDAVR